MLLNERVVSVMVRFVIVDIKVYIFELVDLNSTGHICTCAPLASLLISNSHPCFRLSLAGVRWTISTLSEAPTKASSYANQGMQYVKDLTK